MLKKLKIILVFASLSITLCLMSNTYSRYVASSEGNVQGAFAKWQILINTNDITNNTSSNIIFEPTIEPNENVKEGTVAPSSKGYFDINIDPTNVDVSFKYSIDLNIINKNMPDLMITKYAILPKNYIEGSSLQYITLTDNKITNTLSYPNKAFEKFTIRVFFEWYEGTNEAINDTGDTEIGIDAANNNTKFNISATIQFEQII